jgi:NhaA family Na+:H+ antiporter
VTLGVLLGLVLGKIVGITVFAYAAQRLGFAEVPEGVTPGQFLGVAAIAGIGFTVSLFITELAFDEASIIDEAKVGILAASILAALVGALILRLGAGAGSDEIVAAAREDG